MFLDYNRVFSAISVVACLKKKKLSLEFVRLTAELCTGVSFWSVSHLLLDSVDIWALYIAYIQCIYCVFLSSELDEYS